MARWHKVAQISDIPVGEGKTVDIFGKPIALFNNNGVFQAIDNGVVCPLHQWTFDLEKGHNIRNPQMQLKIYPTVVQGNDIYIEV